MSDAKYFQLLFIVKYWNEEKQRFLNKTISSYVNKYEKFEETVNSYQNRFKTQGFEIDHIAVLTSVIDFKDDWEQIRLNESVVWKKKTFGLMSQRPDIKYKELFRAPDFHREVYS